MEADQYIRMVALRRLQDRNEKPKRLRGGKTAYVDEIPLGAGCPRSTRVAQVETGELDFADDLNLDSYDRLEEERQRPRHRFKPYYWLSR